MPFPPSAACRFFDLPPVNLQNLPLHLTKNSFASAPTHLCGIAYIFHHLLLRKNPRLLRKEAEGGGIAATSYCFVPFRHDQRTEPVWRLCDRPLETFAPLTFELVAYPMSAGRGGSVSRRDHNQATGNRAQLAWAHKSVGTHKPIPIHSSGEGVWGRGASLREAASPPEFPLLVSSGGSAREGASLQRSPLPRIPRLSFAYALVGRWREEGLCLSKGGRRQM